MQLDIADPRTTISVYLLLLLLAACASGKPTAATVSAVRLASMVTMLLDTLSLAAHDE